MQLTTTNRPTLRAAVGVRMTRALAHHWPEYLMEAAALGIFIFSACVVGVLLEHPGSPIHQAIEYDLLRRALMGVAMGITAIGIIHSPWGRQSGAHMNPAVTLSFLSLGKIEKWDAIFYIAAQFAGGAAGVWIARAVVGYPLSHSAVNYVATVPGPSGVAAAFAAEFAISLILMSAVLYTSNDRRWMRLTPVFAGVLVAAYITVEAPISGMSMNPARTFASAVPSGEWTALWLYFTAPPAGMLLAAFLYRLSRGSQRVFCAKLHHHNNKRCIFRCNHDGLRRSI